MENTQHKKIKITTYKILFFPVPTWNRRWMKRKVKSRFQRKRIWFPFHHSLSFDSCWDGKDFVVSSPCISFQQKFITAICQGKLELINFCWKDMARPVNEFFFFLVVLLVSLQIYLWGEGKPRTTRRKNSFPS